VSETSGEVRRKMKGMEIIEGERKAKGKTWWEEQRT